MGVPGFQGTDGVPVSKQSFSLKLIWILFLSSALHPQIPVLEESSPSPLCRVTLVSRVAEDHRDWMAVTGPEEIPDPPALGQEYLDPLDSLCGETSYFIHSRV